MQPLRITLVQTDLHWEAPAANLSMLEQKIHAVQDTHLIVLPEMFTTGFSMNVSLAESMDGPAASWLKQTAQKKNTSLCGSVMIHEGNKYYNRLLWVSPDANVLKYDKRHLFSLSGEEKVFTSGKEHLTTSINGWNVRALICYDLRFPVWCRNSRLAPYDVLLLVANWPQRRSYAWQQLLIARAIENQCYVIAVNRVGNDGNGIYHSGHTMVINPLGEVLYNKADEEDVFTTQLDYHTLQEVRNNLPFLNDSDSFTIL